MKLKVSPYKNGSIITGKVGVPVKIDGSLYMYGERLMMLLSISNLL